jgi:signal transduction histidine kinase
MSLLAWCQWLEHTPFALAIAESAWLFPLIEGTHILALPISVGMILIFDLRLLGLAFRDGAPATIMREMLRWSKAGFGIMFVTGVLLFMTHAGKAYGNAFFRTKLLFLLLLGINAVVYQVLFFPKMAQWDVARRTPLGARLCAGVSLIAWITVIICGRTMAYQF